MMNPSAFIRPAMLWLLLSGLTGAVPVEIRLADAGTARFPVVVAPGAGERERAAADELAVMLGRITGAEFSVIDGDGMRGLAVGRAEAFPELGMTGYFDSADRAPRDIILSSPHAGLHRLDIAPAANSALVKTPDGMARTMSAGREPGNRLMSLWSLYFYVPHGTEIVGGYTERARGQVLDGEGTPVYDFSERDAPAFFKIPVPPGQDGRFWKFNRTSGRQILLTVPPYLARIPAELLIPREVLDADTATHETRP